MRNYKIHFIRHGLTLGNTEGRYVGRTDMPVSDEGLAALRELEENFDYPYIERLYTSPLTRCIQTADILYPNVPKTVVDDLIELDFGAFEGKKYEELKYDTDYQNWLANSYEHPPLLGERSDVFLQRIVNAVDFIFRDMMAEKIFDAAIFTHGGVIMNLFSSIGLPRHQLSTWVTENGKGYTTLFTPQMWTRDGCFEIYATLPYNKENDDE